MNMKRMLLVAALLAAPPLSWAAHAPACAQLVWDPQHGHYHCVDAYTGPRYPAGTVVVIGGGHWLFDGLHWGFASHGGHHGYYAGHSGGGHSGGGHSGGHGGH